MEDLEANMLALGLGCMRCGGRAYRVPGEPCRAHRRHLGKGSRLEEARMGALDGQLLVPTLVENDTQYTGDATQAGGFRTSIRVVGHAGLAFCVIYCLRLHL